MDHLMLFEKFGLTTGIKPHPQMEEFVRDRIGWNGGISDCLDVVSTKAMGIVKNGFVRTGTTTSTGEDALVKIITRFYFGRNTPKTVSSDLWDRYERIWESYWRGVSEHRYVSDLAYDGSFTGGQNIYQGTWMTTDREYAAKYADQSDPDTLIHILKNPSMRLCMIVAVGRNLEIGQGDHLPWHLPEDMLHFRRMTSGDNKAVIMGRATYESLGRPLPNRLNIVVSREDQDGVITARSIDDAVALAAGRGCDECWVIGGRRMYEQAIEICHAAYVTRVDIDFPEADVRLDCITKLSDHMQLESTERLNDVLLVELWTKN